jgi:N-acetylneuraminate synthase
MFRRSLYIVKDMQAGDVLSLENLRSIRPGFGLPPKFLNTLIGRPIARSAPAGTPADWSLFTLAAE